MNICGSLLTVFEYNSVFEAAVAGGKSSQSQKNHNGQVQPK